VTAPAAPSRPAAPEPSRREARATRRAARRARLDARVADGSAATQLFFVLVSVETRDRVFLLAGQAFFAVVPFTIVLVSVLSSVWSRGESARFSDLLVERYAVDADVAATIEALFAQPQPDGTTAGVGLVSGVLLLVSFTAFNRSLRRTFEHAWRRPTLGLAPALFGTTGLVIIVVMLGTSTWLPGWLAARGLDTLLGAVAATVAAQLAVYTAFWWLALWILLQRSVPWGVLRRGAVFAGILQVVTGWVAGTAMPVLLERNAERYGVIGIAFAIIAWLLIHAAAVVAVAVVSAFASGVVERPIRVVPPTGTLAAPVGSRHPDAG